MTDTTVRREMKTRLNLIFEPRMFPGKGRGQRFVANMLRACSSALVGLLLAFSEPANSQDVDSQEYLVESPRPASNGEKITASVIYESMTDKPITVLVVLPSQSGEGQKQPTLKINRHEPAHFPLSRNRKSLLQSGIAMAWMGWPSHAQLGKDGTASHDMQESISSVIAHVRQRWPGVRLVLTGTYGGSRTALTFALKHRESVDGMLLLSPYWMRERSENVESLKALKTLVLHDVSGECIATSNLEIEEISTRAGFSRIPVHQDGIGQIGNCNEKSAVWLAAADSNLTDVVRKWIDGQSIPDHLGADIPSLTTRERVVFVKGNSGQMEITLYSPPGKGPFPLFMFNHGDMDIESSYIRYKQRVREPLVSAPFLNLGFAVAVVARPGAGRSEGRYFMKFAANDGDALYKARFHAESITAALAGLQAETDLDLEQILLSGQSAGGYAVMHMNSLSIPGVRGIVNFSGGRSNTNLSEAPSFENRMMIDGWAEMGKAAKTPVMLIFAENDSRYSANTIRKSTQAFQDAGGKAELLLLPAQPRDGHLVYLSAAKWSSAVRRFVAGLNMGNKPLVSDDPRKTEIPGVQNQ